MTRPYQVLASYYRRVMEHVDYKDWADFLKSILRLHLRKPKSLLELGAGDGELSKYFRLPSLTLRVTTDISPEMISAANPGNAGHRAVVNASQLPFSKPFDLILMTYDAINYLSKKQIDSLFAESRRLLTGDGVFIFDATTELNSRLYFEEEDFAEEWGDVYMVRRSRYDSRKKKQRNHFDFFIRHENGAYSRKTEDHEQTVYPHEFFLKAGERHGLELLGAYADFTLNSDVTEALRVHYIFTKKRMLS
ncbi:MAG: class I SAM-dependent methyltransferase [Fibrobacter sp.]|jgi:ubiquinone/menaquinone biosynthesis C-methylase UbiE|nr:class I SAM-dependent methyltransferase [Fibrobacter sp.]